MGLYSGCACSSFGFVGMGGATLEFSQRQIINKISSRILITSLLLGNEIHFKTAYLDNLLQIKLISLIRFKHFPKIQP